MRHTKSAVEGWGSGLLGVLIFSGSLPATRLAVLDLSPTFLTSARAAIAALLSTPFLVLLNHTRPNRSDLAALGVVAGGVVVGFPLLTALALQHISSARSIVFIGLLPLATAAFGFLRGGERPRPLFWLFSLLGSLTVVAFALSAGGAGSVRGDLLMIAAIVVCGLGYAEGARLSRRLGGWQVISWALALAAPVMLCVAVLSWPPSLRDIGMAAWCGLAYVSLFSMLIGFVFWYRGLALGGIASVGQLQLLQPFFGLALASLILGEPVTWPMIAAAGLIVAFIGLGRRYA